MDDDVGVEFHRGHSEIWWDEFCHKLEILLFLAYNKITTLRYIRYNYIGFIIRCYMRGLKWVAKNAERCWIRIWSLKTLRFRILQVSYINIKSRGKLGNCEIQEAKKFQFSKSANQMVNSKNLGPFFWRDEKFSANSEPPILMVWQHWRTEIFKALEKRIFTVTTKFLFPYFVT